MLKKLPFKEKFFTAYVCLELLIVNSCLLVSQWLDHGASHQDASSLDSGDDSLSYTLCVFEWLGNICPHRQPHLALT